VQERLAVSRREYHREHRAALESLTSLLRERLAGPDGQGSEAAAPGVAEAAAESAAEPGDRPPPLPLSLTSFIGRERERAEVARLLASARLLTLTGPPGTGKTRLAVQTAAELMTSFADGVAFVPLAAVSDHDLVLPSVAHALGLPEAGGRSPLTALKEHLQGKNLLLVLDNFEQVVGAAPSVAELLAACSRLTALVTSRIKLNVYGEQEFAVPPLALPGLEPPPSQEHRVQMLRFESVRLFEERAQAVKADFALTDENAVTVATICRRLDGLPLAIELAAARGKLLPPQALLIRLEQRLPMLTGGPRDLPARQQTLRGAIDWSYDLLTPDERTLLRRLAVFVGGCTLEAVEDTCDADGALAFEVLDGLSSLADESLLSQEEAADGESRFVMLETIREYGLERLIESGEATVVQGRHAAFYLALAQQAEPHLARPDQAVWLARLEREHPNVTAALRWFGDRGEIDHALRLVDALSSFWIARGHLTEGRELLAGLLATPSVAARTAGRARALDAAGSLAFCQRAYAAARPLLEESLAIRRELGERAGMVGPLAALGGTARQLGDQATAQTLYEESLALCQELGFLPGIVNSLHGLAELANERGDYHQAQALHEDCVSMCRQMGFSVGVAIHLHQLGLLAERQGDLGAASRRFEESLTIRRELGDRRGEAQSLMHLGAVAVAGHDYAAAQSWLAASLAMHRDLGDQAGLAMVLERFAALAVARGQPDRALWLAGAAFALRAKARTPLPPDAVAQLDRMLAPARDTLGERAAAACWGRGTAMDAKQATADALRGD